MTLVVGWMGSQLEAKCLASMVKEASDGSQDGLADVFGSSRTQRRQRARLSRFKYWRVVRVDQAMGGAFARASILRRALTSNSYEGCPRARRMISLLACCTTRPGRQMIPKRTAFRRFLFQSPPRANCFIAEFRACPVLRYGVECQHNYCPPRGVGPEPARWQPPARKVILHNSMHLLALPTPLSDDTVHAIGHHRPLPPPL